MIRRPTLAQYAAACDLLLAGANMHAMALPLSELVKPCARFQSVTGRAFQTVDAAFTAAQDIVDRRTVAA